MFGNTGALFTDDTNNRRYISIFCVSCCSKLKSVASRLFKNHVFTFDPGVNVLELFVYITVHQRYCSFQPFFHIYYHYYDVTTTDNHFDSAMSCGTGSGRGAVCYKPQQPDNRKQDKSQHTALCGALAKDQSGPCHSVTRGWAATTAFTPCTRIPSD